jgi:hypothetical protein
LRNLLERRDYFQPKVARCGRLQRSADSAGHPARDGDCEKIRAGNPAAAGGVIRKVAENKIKNLECSRSLTADSVKTKLTSMARTVEDRRENVLCAYYTHSDPIRSYMMSRLALADGQLVLEPAAGDGAFVESSEYPDASASCACVNFTF